MGKQVLTVDRSLLREAYDLVLSQWPDVVVPGEKTYHLNGGCNMRAFNEARFRVEEWATLGHFRPEVDEIISTVEHYVHQAMHSVLRDLTSLRKADLDFEAFVSRFGSHPNFKVVGDPSS